MSRAEGLVENFWRGMQDWHCTLASKCDPGCTRWGSSVQITTKGVLAVQRFIRDHNASTDAVVDAYERIDVSFPYPNLPDPLDIE